MLAFVEKLIAILLGKKIAKLLISIFILKLIGILWFVVLVVIDVVFKLSGQQSDWLFYLVASYALCDIYYLFWRILSNFK